MQSFDEIYQQYAQTVYKYLLSLTYQSDLSEELIQETFYQALRTIDRYDGKCRISTWLCGIAMNVLLTYRRKHPQHEDIDDLAIPVESSEQDLADHGRRDRKDRLDGRRANLRSYLGCVVNEAHVRW